MTILAISDPNVFIGMSLNDARTQIAGYGYSVRIYHVDGRDLTLTKDYDPLRINLRIEYNRVTAAFIG